MRHANRFLAAFAVLVTVPLLYVLSLGPVIWLADQGWLSEDLLTVYVYPAELAFPEDTMRMEVLRHYLLLWSK